MASTSAPDEQPNMRSDASMAWAIAVENYRNIEHLDHVHETFTDLQATIQRRCELTERKLAGLESLAQCLGTLHDVSPGTVHEVHEEALRAVKGVFTMYRDDDLHSTLKDWGMDQRCVQFWPNTDLQTLSLYQLLVKVGEELAVQLTSRVYTTWKKPVIVSLARCIEAFDKRYKTVKSQPSSQDTPGAGTQPGKAQMDEGGKAAAKIESAHPPPQPRAAEDHRHSLRRTGKLKGRTTTASKSANPSRRRKTRAGQGQDISHSTHAPQPSLETASNLVSIPDDLFSEESDYHATSMLVDELCR